MATRKTFSFTDFRGGWVSRTAGPVNLRSSQFTGVNVQPCLDGSLTVRKGLRKIPISGVPSGQVRGFGTVPALTNNLWFIVGNTVYRAYHGSSASSLGTLAATPSAVVPWAREGFSVVITVDGDKCYRVNPIGGALTALSGTPGGQAMFVRGRRLHVCDGNTVKWSVIGDFADFSITGDENDGGEETVGDTNLDISAVCAVRDGVYLCKTVEGTWVMTGEAADGYAFRKATSAIAAVFHAHITEWEGAPLYHRTNASGQSPVRLTGARPEPMFELAAAVQSGTLLSPQEDLGVLGNVSDGTVIIVDGTDRKALLWGAPGCWSYHSFDGVPALRGSAGELNGQDGTLLIASQNAADGFYYWRADVGPVGEQDRPGFESDTYARAGDNSADPVVGEFTCPEIVADDGSMLRPVEVVVDFLSYANGGSQANSLSAQVSASRMPDRASNTTPTSGALTWTETTTPTTTGSRRTARFQVGDQPPGPGFWVRIHNMRGVRVLGVRVVADVARPQDR